MDSYQPSNESGNSQDVFNTGSETGGSLFDNISNTLKKYTDIKVDLTVGATEYQVGKILANRSAYGKIVSPVIIKTVVANLGVSAKALQVTGNVLKGTGVALGVVGVGLTVYDISTGQKNLIGEGGLDLIMGGVGFIPGGGWIVSGAYFGGKALLETTGNDFWNQ